MSPSTASPARTLLRPVFAVVLLVVIVMLVMSYWGNYRSSREPAPGGETTSTIEATETVSEEAGEEPTQNEATDSEPVANTTESLGTVVVLIDGLNFRTGPSRDSDLIRGLNKGDRLTHLATEDGWYKVSAADGMQGYVSASSQYTRVEQ